jgi:2-polyprenyl-3-methyl-5-hydroxy-6-metoxy-1,4-benzoquinol methylase
MTLMRDKDVNVWPSCMTDDLDQFRLLAAHLSGGTSNIEIKDMVINLVKDHGIRGRILDFGAGKGELISLLAHMDGMELHGADIMKRPENIPAYVNWYQQDLNDTLRCVPASFDAIICSEVIEHLENPRSVFRNLFAALKPGGKLVLTMPNQENVRSFFTLIFRGQFALFQEDHYPAHITALLRVDLIRICRETGFSEPYFYYTNRGWMPKVWTTWQRASMNLLRGRLFSDNLGMVVTKRDSVQGTIRGTECGCF